eukprot:Colp12_sorted_trinity150504_noHs@7248
MSSRRDIDRRDPRRDDIRESRHGDRHRVDRRRDDSGRREERNENSRYDDRHVARRAVDVNPSDYRSRERESDGRSVGGMIRREESGRHSYNRYDEGISRREVSPPRAHERSVEAPNHRYRSDRSFDSGHRTERTRSEEETRRVEESRRVGELKGVEDPRRVDELRRAERSRRVEDSRRVEESRRVDRLANDRQLKESTSNDNENSLRKAKPENAESSISARSRDKATSNSSSAKTATTEVTPAYDPTVDFLSPEFDPLKALYADLTPPVPNVRVYDNLIRLEQVLFPSADSKAKKPKADASQASSSTIPMPPSGATKQAPANTQTEGKSADKTVITDQDTTNVRSKSKGEAPKGPVGLGRKKNKDVLMRMELLASGPLGTLRSCMSSGQRVRVILRDYKGVHGYCEGFLKAFDKHMNVVSLCYYAISWWDTVAVCVCVYRRVRKWYMVYTYDVHRHI